MAKKATKKTPDYTITLKLNGQEYSGTGSTLQDALLALPQVTPKTKGIFVVDYDGKRSKECAFLIKQMRFLFVPGKSGDIYRSIFLKQLTLRK